MPKKRSTQPAFSADAVPDISEERLQAFRELAGKLALERTANLTEELLPLMRLMNDDVRFGRLTIERKFEVLREVERLNEVVQETFVEALGHLDIAEAATLGLPDAEA